jgi:VIT1/CCC1 family predicted Fe2+/Mn2+ transporter
MGTLYPTPIPENIMLISLIVTLIIVGVCLYILTLIPMDNVIKQIIRVVVLLVALLYVLEALGIWHSSVPLR